MKSIPFSIVARGCASLVIVAGLTVLCGWATGVDILKSLLPGYAWMKANTAAAFILNAVALIALVSPRHRRSRLGAVLPLVAAALAAVLAALNLAEYATGISFGLDEAVFRDLSTFGAPGRMAPNTAIAVLLASAAVLLLCMTRTRPRLIGAGIVSLLTTLLGFIALTGYASRVPAAYGWGLSNPMALPTALLIVLMGVGELVVCWEASGRAWHTPGWLLAAVSGGFVIVIGLDVLTYSMAERLSWLTRATPTADVEIGRTFLYISVATYLALGLYVAVLFYLNIEIADRAQAERRMHDSEEMFRSFFQEAPIGNAIVDADGAIVAANQAICDLLGFSETELIGRPISSLVHPDDRAARDEAAEAMRAGKLDRSAADRRFVAKDGRIPWIASTARLLRDSRGLPARFIVHLIDITDRKNAELAIRRLNAQLEHRVAERTTELSVANKELEAFAYSVAHDLRAPLRSVDGFSRLLLKESAAKLNEDERDNLERVRNATRRMAELIDDILKLSRVSRAELRRIDVDLSSLAQDIARELVAEQPRENMTLAIASGLRATGDPVLLRAVLQNLLHNAWKFTSGTPAPRIDFQQLPDRDVPTFCVRDNGAGFEMEYAHKLFQPFQRLHDPEEFPGNGIGLATVQRIVRRHGGRVWAEGQVGQGAAFYFTLSNS